MHSIAGVPGLLATVTGVMRKHHRRLDASVGASGPHDFGVRSNIARLIDIAAAIASRPTFVTTRTPLLSRRDVGLNNSDLGRTRSEIFFRTRLDDPNHVESVHEIAILARTICHAEDRMNELYSGPTERIAQSECAAGSLWRPLKPASPDEGDPRDEWCATAGVRTGK